MNDKCTEIYSDVREAISAETLTFKGEVTKLVAAGQGFSARIQDRVDAILAGLALLEWTNP